MLDGREFIRERIQALYSEGKRIHHVLMNLPVTAHKFVDSFKYIFPKGAKLPTVHLYCFANGDENWEQIALKQAEEVMGCSIVPDEILKIRQTSTRTMEFCIRFVVPSEVAYLPE